MYFNSMTIFKRNLETEDVDKLFDIIMKMMSFPLHVNDFIIIINVYISSI
jgi:hypothetical protein